MSEKWKRYIIRYTILLLIPVMAFLAGCANNVDADYSEIAESAEMTENVESDGDSVKKDEGDIKYEEDNAENGEVDITYNIAETEEEEIADDSEDVDAHYDTDLSTAEVYELFLNGELTAAQEVYIKREGEPEEEQVTIDELFWGNDIEYCFSDIDGDGSEELHIRDDAVYYTIKAGDGILQIIFKGLQRDKGMCRYEPVVTDEVCGILYYSYGYGSEHIEFLMISTDGSTESDGEFRWHDQNKNGSMDEEDSFDIDYVKDINMEQYVQYREEQIAKQTENESEWTERRLKDFATWQEAYIDYINKPESTIWTSKNGSDYSLIYVDDDDVPELYIHTGIMATGAFIVSFYDGNVRAMNRERGGIEYMEYGGLFYSDWGNMGFHPCDVYMLEKGEFSEIGTGWLSEAYDEENPDNWWFEYFWEGSLMTEAEYEECLNKLIDTSKCVEPAELYTQDEMLKILAEWE